MGIHAYQTNFTGGALSPHMFSRVDFDKYANGAQIMTNMVARVTGGAARRAGTQMIAPAKGSGFGAFQANAFQNDAFQVTKHRSVRLVPFIFNTDQSYVLEFGPFYIRFYRNRQQIVGLDAAATSLILNGDFGGGLASWSADFGGGGSVTAPAGLALLNAGPSGIGFTRLWQQITGLTAGERYAFAFRVDNSNVELLVGANQFSDDLVEQQSLTPGEYRVVFTATSSTATITFVNNVVNTEARIDDVVATPAVPVELVTPYTADELRALRYTQSADTFYIAHTNHEPRKLLRLSDQLWTLQIIPFSTIPSEEVALLPPATLTIGATSGTSITFTASASVFVDADINKTISYLGGLAIITAFVSGTQVTVDILQPFLNLTPIGAGSWQLKGSPSTLLTLSLLSPAGAVHSFTATLPAFRSTDVNKYIVGGGGISQIYLVVSSTVVHAKIVRAYTGPGMTLASGAWTLESDSWSNELGWPGVVCFFEQRLWFASTRQRPQTIWGSSSADFEDFTPGPDKDNSVEFTIASNTVDIIRWIKASKAMIMGTIGSEFKADGGSESTITPTNILVQSDTTYGSNYEPDACRVGHAVIFVQRGGRQIRELAFVAESDSYQAPDLTILAEHLFRTGIVEITRMASPDSYIFAVLENGHMAVAAYERPEKVVAWSEFITQGDYVSVCVIPAKCGAGDEVWVAVNRDVAGGGATFVEVFDGQLNTDCALNHDSTALADTLVGLGHLEGATVDVKYRQSDGFQSGAFQPFAFQTDEQGAYFEGVVTTASMTVPQPSNYIEVGLHYESILTTLRSELAGPTGTMHFRKKRSNVLYVRFYCSRGPGIFVEDEAVPQNPNKIRDFRKFNLGWDREGQVTIRQTQPFPMIVLGVSYAWSIDDGDA